MKNHRVLGHGGVRLHVVETGNTAGRPILFIHGVSQSWRSWSRQMNSDLADDFRLVALDLRGHGLSDKPRDGYADSRAWADDIDAVIRALQLDRLVLCGWSYGPLVILDYIRFYGEDAVGGIDIVGGVTKLGSEKALALLTPEFLALVPGFFSTDTGENARSLESLLHLCFATKLTLEELRLMLEPSLTVPPYVRQGMFSRTVDNDDLLPTLRTPVLISHGARDAVVKRLAVEQHQARVPHAQVHLMANAGHGCFWDDPAGFNQRLRSFANSRESSHPTPERLS